MENKDVFISYKAEEFDDANWVKCTLENNGISCWMAPASIPGGSSYASEIPQAIRNCKVFVLLLSEKSQLSKWVPRELDQAINENKIVMPFMLENCALKDDFNFYLTNVQRYAAYESKANAIEKMIKEINSVLGTKAITQNRNINVSTDLALKPDIKSKKRMVALKKTPKLKKLQSFGKNKKHRVRPGACVAAAIILVIIITASALYNVGKSSKILIAGKKFRSTDSYVSITGVTLTEDDLTLFDNFEKLTTINLRECKFECDSIRKLCRPELYSLSLVNCGLTNKKLQSMDFAILDKLSSLDISENDISEGSVFGELNDSLNKLNISGTSISDLSAFSSFEKLSELQASGNGINTLSPLASCKELTMLELNDNNISDLSPLAACVQLRSLYINGNKLTTLNGLEMCIDLTEIEAGSNEITTIYGLSNATVLRNVYLSDNRISDISVLSKSSNTLQNLHVRNNQIENFDFPSGFPALSYLNIDNNSIVSLKALEKSTNLEGVSARNNQITSVEGLENKQKLNYLDLSNNQIQITGDEDIQLSSYSMVVVNLGGNKIANLNLNAKQGYKYLNLHNTGLSEHEFIYDGTGNDLIIDYNEKIDFASLRDAVYSTYYIIGCPLDKQVSVRDTLGIYSVQFVDATVCDEVMSDYISVEIKGNPVYFKWDKEKE